MMSRRRGSRPKASQRRRVIFCSNGSCLPFLQTSRQSSHYDERRVERNRSRLRLGMSLFATARNAMPRMQTKTKTKRARENIGSPGPRFIVRILEGDPIDGWSRRTTRRSPIRYDHLVGSYSNIAQITSFQNRNLPPETQCQKICDSTGLQVTRTA